ncbi:unnamed protein product [Dicrocoelium dendriticum]|nr:unnamed protein product [Dicrocoelium dendriticum]
MFTSTCLLLLAIAFAPCQLERQHVIMITGILIKDGNMLPFTSEKELEDNPSSRHVEDICIKYDKTVSTENRSSLKNFTCVVSGPHLGHLEGEFVLRFESDKVDVSTLTKEGLEKRNQEGTGYFLAELQLKFLNATS